MLCDLDKEINKCHFFDNELCKNKNKCSFQVPEDSLITSEEYIREDRWYEKYFKKWLGIGKLRIKNIILILSGLLNKKTLNKLDLFQIFPF